MRYYLLQHGGLLVSEFSLGMVTFDKAFQGSMCRPKQSHAR
jgi:hypothetical protein